MLIIMYLNLLENKRGQKMDSIGENMDRNK